MSGTFIIFAGCLFCLLAGFIAGAEIEARDRQQKLDEQFREFLAADNKSWAVVADLRKQLAKFQRPRDASGKFIGRHKPDEKNLPIHSD